MVSNEISHSTLWCWWCCLVLCQSIYLTTYWRMFICRQVWLFCVLMFLSFLLDFRVVGGYSWGSSCLAWLYREMCWVSHVQACYIVDPLILLQLWVCERFPCIGPQRLEAFPHDIIGNDGLPFPPPPLGIWYIQQLIFSCKNSLRT